MPAFKLVVRALAQWTVLAAILVCVGLAYVADPVFGFASVTALIAFSISGVLEYRKFRVERRFFFGSEASRISYPLVVSLSLVNSLARALVVGAAALLTFSDPQVFVDLSLTPKPAGILEPVWQSQNTQLLDYAFTLETATESLELILIALIGAGVLVSVLIDQVTAGRGHHWSLFQLAGLFGVAFSLCIVLMQDADEEAFKAPTPLQVSIAFERVAADLPPLTDLYDPSFLCRKILRGDASVPIEDRVPQRGMADVILDQATGKSIPNPYAVFGELSCAYRLKEDIPAFTDYCDIDESRWQRRFTLRGNPPDYDKWGRAGCMPVGGSSARSDAQSSRVAENLSADEYIRRLLVTTAVVDGFIDEQVSRAITIAVDEDTSLGAAVAWLARVLISAKLLQGLVIAVYVTLVVLLLAPRRVG